MKDPLPAIQVTSLDEEDHLMGRCTCGGAWTLAFNEVVLRRRLWIDHLAVRCRSCETRMVFEFDVSDFFQARPGVWALPSISPRGPVIAFAPSHRASVATHAIRAA